MYVRVAISKQITMSILRGHLWWPTIFIPGKAIQSEQMACIGRNTFDHKAIRKTMFQELLSPSKFVDIGDDCRDSDCENDASSSDKTDAVVGIFKQH